MKRSAKVHIFHQADCRPVQMKTNGRMGGKSEELV